MKKVNLLLRKNWFKIISSLFLTIIPAIDFYSIIFMKILGFLNITTIKDLSQLQIISNLPSIITGLLLAGMFWLFVKSRNEYDRIKGENKRIMEMLLTIHLFDNIRFAKIGEKVMPDLFLNEEQILKTEIKRIFKKDLGNDYSETEIAEILDTFYRKKPKFYEINK